MARRKKNNRKKRPIAVTVIAAAIVALFLIRLYQVFEPLIRQQVFQNGIAGPLLDGWRLTDLGRALLSSVTYFVLSVAGIAVLIGFLRLRRWSWVLLMSWTGISLAITLVNYFYAQRLLGAQRLFGGQPNYAVMASNVIIAFALNMTEVQQIFGIRRDESVPSL
jgi:ABC-type multidrug transport system fused ATPase/permease subunit